MEQIAVIASGMVTAIGYNSPATCAAIRAGISGIEDIYLMEYKGSPNFLRGAKVALPQWWNGIDKLVDLVCPAIYECLIHIPEQQWSSIPILLGVSLKQTQFLGDYTNGELLEKIEAKLGLQHHVNSHIICEGQTSGVTALERVPHLLNDDTIPYCIIAGVDSYLHRETVDYYLKQRRILTSKNSNGFYPGEAGTAILVGASSAYPKATIHIAGIGRAKEKVTISSEEPFHAKGMNEAIKHALTDSGITLDNVACHLTDINGEYYKFNESNLALMRFNRPDNDINMEIWHPIEYVGEIGAAIVPLLLGLAMNAKQKNDSLGKCLLLHVGNDEEERAALIVKC